MMRNLQISSRLILLIVAQVLVILLIGGAGLISMKSAATTRNVLNETVNNQGRLSLLDQTLRINLMDTVDNLDAGRITWEEAADTLTASRHRFENNWTDYRNNLTVDEAEITEDIYKPGLAQISRVFDEIEVIIKSRDRGRLDLFVTNDFAELVEPYFSALQGRTRLAKIESQEAFEKAKADNTLYFNASVAILIVGVLVAGFLGFVIYRSISQPVARIADTVRQINSGALEARSGVSGKDELGQLGQAFDTLLEDKVLTLAQAERENEALNNSVIALLQAVSQLSQKDLTIRVPVSEDVTGPVADALNLLTDETAKVLGRVRQISDDVATTSSTVKAQSDAVMTVANTEHEEIVRTSSELAAASEAMNEIAELAQTCNTAADNAIEKAQQALETVTSTVTGINNTRDTIRETEKRIKRLGERSQEISGAVNLINNIAERTHILALNASMHAASAGEAGRGFAVVADEVQRLAENAREATSQIADLVNNIQTETADTVATMNAAISQVVEGSRLAEQAGKSMTETQQTTAELVSAVQQIAAESQTQAHITSELRTRAGQIEASTLATQHQLEEQTYQTDNLMAFSRGLVEAVRVFTLPDLGLQDRKTKENNLRMVQS